MNRLSGIDPFRDLHENRQGGDLHGEMRERTDVRARSRILKRVCLIGESNTIRVSTDTSQLKKQKRKRSLAKEIVFLGFRPPNPCTYLVAIIPIFGVLPSPCQDREVTRSDPTKSIKTKSASPRRCGTSYPLGPAQSTEGIIGDVQVLEIRGHVGHLYNTGGVGLAGEISPYCELWINASGGHA